MHVEFSNAGPNPMKNGASSEKSSKKECIEQSQNVIDILTVKLENSTYNSYLPRCVHR